MKLVTFRAPDGSARPGALLANFGGAVDIAAGLARGNGSSAPGTVTELLQRGPGELARVAELLDVAGNDQQQARAEAWYVAEDDLHPLAPLGERPFVLCSGRNYFDHIREMKELAERFGRTGIDEASLIPKEPEAFIKSPNAIIGPDQPIRIPAALPDMVDYEGELGVVFGRECFDVDAGAAMDYVAGYTVINDVSARDAVLTAVMAKTPVEGRDAYIAMMGGKQFPTFCPMGPAVVTVDEVPDPHQLRITTTLNGEVMQDSNTADFIFDIPKMISFFSKCYVFQPGDVLSTGSPAGVGSARNPQVFMHAGDDVCVTVESVGSLRNPVAGP